MLYGTALTITAAAVILGGTNCGVYGPPQDADTEISGMAFSKDEKYYNLALDYIKNDFKPHSKEAKDFHVFADYEGYRVDYDSDIKTAYMWVYAESYYVSDGLLYNEEGVSIACKIVFDNDDNISSCQFPEDGSGYVASIEEMFPINIRGKVLALHTLDLTSQIENYYSYLDSTEVHYKTDY